MATTGSDVVTLKDYLNIRNPGGGIDKVIELLANQHGIVEDILWREANDVTSHTLIARTGLPTVYDREYNKGTPASKGTTKRVIETLQKTQSVLTVDEELLLLEGNKAAFLLSEAEPHFQAMRDKFATQVFYGNQASNDLSIDGLANRYAYSDGPNVVDFGGSGADCTSLWFIAHGENTFTSLYPKGSPVGLRKDHRGIIPTTDSDGNHLKMDFTFFNWDFGIAVKDWRYIVRCANIESAGLEGTGTNNLIDKLHLMIKARNLLESTSNVKPVIYCNRDVKTQLDIAAFNKVSPTLYTRDIGGEEVTMFRGIPVKREDAILSTETAISAKG